jgi:divalent metal cation (Fe/Co/Zn/Cd) transporter
MTAPTGTVVLEHGSPGWQRAASQAKQLSWASLAYMTAEGAIAIIAAVLAGSVALLALGFDSVIEGAGSIIIVWRFSGARTLSETAERRAQKAVAVSFFALAPYIAYEALAKLSAGEHPATSWLGIGLAVTSLIIMPVFGTAKKRLGARLDSEATTSSGVQNLLCAYLAAAVLIGLLANTVLGWWWLDPAIGMGIAAWAIWEGAEAWRGEA